MFTDINLPSLIPDEYNKFDGALVLDFKNDDVTCNPRIECEELSADVSRCPAET